MPLLEGHPVLVEAPEKLPVSLDEAKRQARVTNSSEDGDIDRRLRAAIEWVESHTGRRLITQTWELRFNGFPGSGKPLRLHYPPLQSVVHVKYVDPAGDEQTLYESPGNVAALAVRTNRTPGEIIEAFGTSWPATRNFADVVRVKYVAGFGPEPKHVPWTIREAICVLAATRQAFREDTITGTIVNEMSAAAFSARRLLRRWRRNTRPRVPGA